MIKDAHDHDVDSPCEVSDWETDLDANELPAECLATGRTRLAALYAARTQWAALPTWKPKHKQRKCIDRRFDGPKHLRTRDYDSDDIWGGGGFGGYSSGGGDY